MALIELSEHCINPDLRARARGERIMGDELSGKVAIVTRGASGIGRVPIAALLRGWRCALRLAEGIELAFTCRNVESRAMIRASNHKTLPRGRACSHGLVSDGATIRVATL